ncbi:MAG: formyltransferase family protein [Bacteroidia bacterium]
MKKKITVLLRYPKVEKNQWKRELIEKLQEEGFEVSIIFGEKSYQRHAFAALKDFGLEIFKKKSSIDQQKSVKLYSYFKDKIHVETVNDLNSSDCEKKIRKINPDYLLLLGSGIIRNNIIVLPKKGAIHCHHGYLPEVRGVSTAEWSMYLGKDVYISTHFVDPGVDTGDILLRKKIPLTPDDTITSVRLNCRLHSVDLIMDTFKLVESGDYEVIKQRPEEGVQYFLMHPFFKDLVNQKLKRIKAEAV